MTESLLSLHGEPYSPVILSEAKDLNQILRLIQDTKYRSE